jgi:hypothetical protein
MIQTDFEGVPSLAVENGKRLRKEKKAELKQYLEEWIKIPKVCGRWCEGHPKLFFRIVRTLWDSQGSFAVRPYEYELVERANPLPTSCFKISLHKKCVAASELVSVNGGFLQRENTVFFATFLN